MSPCPPCSAKTPENSAEPMKSQQTIAVVFAVRKTDCLIFFQSSFDFGATKEGNRVAREYASSETPRRAQSRRSPRCQLRTNPSYRSDQTPGTDLARVFGHDGEIESAERPHCSRFSGRGDAEQNYYQHHHRQHPQRHYRDDQLFQYLKSLTIHAPVVDQQEKGRYCRMPQNHR